MGRAVYPHELNDSDFSWLVNTFRENNPDTLLVESTCLPLVMVKGVPQPEAQFEPDELPIPPGAGEEETDADDLADAE